MIRSSSPCFQQLDVCLANLDDAEPGPKASITRWKDDVAGGDVADRKQMRVTWR